MADLESRETGQTGRTAQASAQARPQSVLDSLADAETLRLNVVNTHWRLNRSGREMKRDVTQAQGFAQDAIRWMRARLRKIAPDMARHYGKWAARAAFRACPGLRG